MRGWASHWRAPFEGLWIFDPFSQATIIPGPFFIAELSTRSAHFRLARVGVTEKNFDELGFGGPAGTLLTQVQRSWPSEVTSRVKASEEHSSPRLTQKHTCLHGRQ
jgi:hypothetical protein